MWKRCDFYQRYPPSELSSDSGGKKSSLPEAKISVDASCCAGVTPESHKNALEAMKMCQITIIE